MSGGNGSKVYPLRSFSPTRALPLEIGVIHFIGIGGIGMSGIAEILHNLGYKVQGSDLTENANTERLANLGIKIFAGHNASNVKEAAVVVISSAVKSTNPELQAAYAERIPVVRRAEMLAELMRFKLSIAVGGTHGKTTTTSLLASLLDTAGMAPTVINGGIINAYGTNARLGSGEWMVVESDESDGSFIKLPSTVAIVTNIDPEHLDHYGSFDNLRAAFRQFVENIPFYGFAVMCIDHPEVQALISKVTDRRIISYGTSPQAHVRGTDPVVDSDGQHFDVELDIPGKPQATLKDIHLPMFGNHNLRNALAVISVAVALDIPEALLRKALGDFKGVKRRFTKTGEAGGVTIIDDYGHHPVEIAATLKAARQVLSTGNGRLIAVVQPHRYTRLRDLFKEFCTCFNDAETVIVAPVYSAGEEPIEGIHRDALVEGLRTSGHKHVLALENEDALAALVAENARPGDMVVCLGAGSITKWAHALPDQLAKQFKNRKKA